MAFETVPQPTTYQERLAIADRTREEFDLRCEIVVDGMDDRSRAFFGDQPNSLFVVGPDSVIRLKQPWADPDELEGMLGEFLEHAPVELADAAKRPGASLRAVVAQALAAGTEADRQVLLRDWPKSASEPGTESFRLRLALRLRDFDPERERFADLASVLRRDLGIAGALEDDEPDGLRDRRLWLGSMFVPLLRDAAPDLRREIADTLRELSSPEGRIEVFLEGRDGR